MVTDSDNIIASWNRKETAMAIRRALAFPLYCVAFALHLMTAVMSAVSAKVAGDDDGSDRIPSDHPR
jgi:hypothetical protein